MKPWLGIVGIVVFGVAAFVAAIWNGQAKSQEAQRPQFTVPANVAPHPPVAQPMPFSDKLHVGMGVPCATCHVNPQIGNDMSLPLATTCMTCHSEVAKDQPDIKRLAEFVASDKPIPWVRMHELPRTCSRSSGDVGANGADIDGHLHFMPPSEPGKAECVTCHSWPSNDPDILGKWSVPEPVLFEAKQPSETIPR